MALVMVLCTERFPMSRDGFAIVRNGRKYSVHPCRTTDDNLVPATIEAGVVWKFTFTESTALQLAKDMTALAAEKVKPTPIGRRPEDKGLSKEVKP